MNTLRRRRIDPVRRGVGHLVRIDGGLVRLARRSVVRPSQKVPPNRPPWWRHSTGPRAERGVHVTLGLAIAKPARTTPGIVPEIKFFRAGSREARRGDVAGGTGVALRIRQGDVVEHELAELLHRRQCDDVGRHHWGRQRPSHGSERLHRARRLPRDVLREQE